MRDFHQSGNATVIIRIRTYEVGAVGNDVVHVQLVPTNMLADEDWRLDDLPQFSVPKGRNAAVLVGILQPEIARLVAGNANLQRISPRLVLACRIEHQVHFAADGFACSQDCCDLALDRALSPTMNFEGWVAHF